MDARSPQSRVRTRPRTAALTVSSRGSLSVVSRAVPQFLTSFMTRQSRRVVMPSGGFSSYASKRRTVQWHAPSCWAEPRPVTEAGFRRSEQERSADMRLQSRSTSVALLRFQGAKKPLNQVAALLEPPNKAQGTWRFDYVSNLRDPKPCGCAENAAEPIGIDVVRAGSDDDITIPVS